MLDSISQSALSSIYALALELMKDAFEGQRTIKVKDRGEYCKIQMSVLIRKEHLLRSLSEKTDKPNKT